MFFCLNSMKAKLEIAEEEDLFSVETETKGAGEEDLNQEEENSLIVGIDLGTTTVVVACYDTETKTVQIVKFQGEYPNMPSEVHVQTFLDINGNIDKRIFTGWEARQINAENPNGKAHFYGFKRFMGVASEDIMFKKLKMSAKDRSYEVEEQIVYVPSASGKGDLEKKKKVVMKIPHPTDPRKYAGDMTPKEASIHLLMAAKSQLKEQFGNKGIRSLVVTVPAYFTEDQRDETLSAAEVAFQGEPLEKPIILVREPVSAALSFFYEQGNLKETKKVDGGIVYSVFDFGGGTLDCTIVTYTEDLQETLDVDNITGNNVLGGIDVDNKIKKIILDKIKKKVGKEAIEKLARGTSREALGFQLEIREKSEQFKKNICDITTQTISELVQEVGKYRQRLDSCKSYTKDKRRHHRDADISKILAKKDSPDEKTFEENLKSVPEALRSLVKDRKTLVEKYGEGATRIAATMPNLHMKYAYLVYEALKKKGGLESTFSIYIKSYVPNYKSDNISVSVTAQEMDTECESIYEDAMKCFHELLHPTEAVANYDSLERKIPNIDSILLIGGSTYLPKIRYLLLSRFCTNIPKGRKETDYYAIQYVIKNGLNFSVDPILAVATGAAYRAARHVNAIDGGGVALIDSLNISFAIRVNADAAEIILPKNSKYPCQVEKVFTTIMDGQKVVKIDICQGELLEFSKNNSLGGFTLELAKEHTNMKKGEPKIKVTFCMNNDSLKVEAADITDLQDEKDYDSDKIVKKSITITNNKYKLSEEEMRRIAEKAQEEEERNEMLRIFIKKRATINGKLEALSELLSSIPEEETTAKFKKYLDDFSSWTASLTLAGAKLEIIERAEEDVARIEELLEEKNFDKLKDLKFNSAKYLAPADEDEDVYSDILEQPEEPQEEYEDL